MIFKTFNNDIDKWTAKIGIFGKSFNELGTAVSNAFKETINNIDNFDENIGFWESLKNNLFSKKDDNNDWIKNSLGEIISKENINSYIEELDLDSAKKKLQSIFDHKELVDSNQATWSEFLDGLKDGEKYLVDTIKNTDDLSKLTGDDLVQANRKAREAAIAHNAALKQQTLGAKAAAVGMKALAIAGNMIAMWAITKGIELVVKGIDNLVHSAEHCKERVDELMSSYQSALDKANSNAKTIENLATRYEELSKGVNNLGENVSLTTDEYGEYNDIVNQIADMFPTLVQGYTDEGNTILSLKGNVEQLRDACKEAQQEAYNMLIISGKDSDGNDIIKNYQNVLSNNNPFIKLDSSAKEYIEIIKSLHKAMLASDEEYDKLYEAMLGGGNKLINDYNMSQAQLNKVKKTLKNIGFQADLTDEDKRNINASVKVYLQTYQAEVNSALKDVQNFANAYLMTNEDYAELDEQSKNAASIIVNSINENIASGFENKVDVGEYVYGIINTIKDNSDVQDALIELFSMDVSKIPVNEAKEIIDTYIQSIADKIGENPVELKTRLGFGDIDDSYKRLQNSIRRLTDDHGMADREEYSDLSEYTSEFTQAQIELWLKTTSGVQNATEAIQRYENELAKNEEKNHTSFDHAWADSFTSENDAVKDLGSNLLELAEQGRLTIGTFNEADSSDYFKNLGISAEEAVSKINKLVDESAQLSSMANHISSISDALGTKQSDGFVSADTLSGFNVEVRGLDAWGRFQEVLGSTTSSYKECQDAANTLAAEWVSNSDFLRQLTSENKEYYKTQLQAMGVENYEAVIAYAQELNSAKDALAQASFDIATATVEEIQSLIDTGTYTELAQQQIWALILAKQTEKGITLNSSADCQSLLALAQNAGVTGDAVNLLTRLMNIYNNIANGVYGTNQHAVESARKEAENLKSRIDNILSNSTKNTVVLKPNIRLNPSARSAAKAAGKETGKSYKEGLQEELSKMGNIISYIGNIIGKQISSFQNQKDATVDALEAQKEAAVDALEAQRAAAEDALNAEKEAIQSQIDAKQAEIDKIQEAAEARKNEINLQQQLYNMERMQNQRTSLVYSEDKGIHYVHNAKGIRDAREAVTEAKENIQIANTQKELDGLNNTLDNIESRIENSNQYYDSLIDSSNQYYDSLIQAAQNYWDTLIRGLENYQSRWEDLADIEDQAKMKIAFKNLGITTDDILSMSESALASFKGNYLGILQEMYSGNGEMINLLRAPGVAGEFKELDTGDTRYELQKKFNAYLDSIHHNTDKLIPHSMYEHNRQMQDTVNLVSNGSIMNKNRPNINIGDIHITCPGVTSQEVARQIGVELSTVFNGLHLDAMQQSMKK